ncbi:MAG: hypothetical protein ACKODH_10810 [Limisphaerales bacterium]
MGLTIHYRLRAPRTLTDEAARVLTDQARTRALALGAVEATEVFEVESDFPINWYFREQTDPKRWPSGPLPPEHGWLFSFDPGQDSESVLLGLCRFPGVPCWHWRGSCKTQYAARHGWEHFFATHRRVLDAVSIWRDLGAEIQVNDEGGYWDSHSEDLLRAKLGEYDRLIAAFSGAMKDTGAEVKGAIFSDPRFEQLEAQGQQEFGEKVRDVLNEMSDLRPATCEH